jgi:hypothetical protein
MFVHPVVFVGFNVVLPGALVKFYVESEDQPDAVHSVVVGRFVLGVLGCEVRFVDSGFG